MRGGGADPRAREHARRADPVESRGPGASGLRAVDTRHRARWCGSRAHAPRGSRAAPTRGHALRRGTRQNRTPVRPRWRSVGSRPTGHKRGCAFGARARPTMSRVSRPSASARRRATASDGTAVSGARPRRELERAVSPRVDPEQAVTPRRPWHLRPRAPATARRSDGSRPTWPAARMRLRRRAGPRCRACRVCGRWLVSRDRGVECTAGPLGARPRADARRRATGRLHLRAHRRVHRTRGARSRSAPAIPARVARRTSAVARTPARDGLGPDHVHRPRASAPTDRRRVRCPVVPRA